MTAPWFFLSYSRLDADPYFVQFRDELINAVRVKIGGARESVAFHDRLSIEQGEDWNEALTGALATSRILVPVFSPSYLRSVSCGREWTVFERRRANWLAAQPARTANAPVILPVLWVGKGDLPKLPAALGEVQWDHETYGESYADAGTWRLVRSDPPAFRTFIHGLADRIVDVGRAFAIPPLPVPPRFEDIENWFEANGDDPVDDTGGPRHVQFLFVAASRAELQGLRERLDAYGSSAPEWRPFDPDVRLPIRDLAHFVAGMERLEAETLELGPDLLERLDAAQRDEKIVVIVVDTWSLHLHTYSSAMQQYDQRNFRNCVVLVPWNRTDPETLERRQALEDLLRVTFEHRARTRDPATFIDSIATPEDLPKHLSSALAGARARIIETAEVRKRVEGAGLIAKPIISARSGA
jgi:FxsC-like protein